MAFGVFFGQMSDRMTTGRRGETLAAEYLRERGYTIEALNYRYGRTEIDIVAARAGIIVFVEVKTRSSLAFGHPSQFFKPAQQRRISRAAGAYMDEVDHEGEIRFDLVTVVLQRNTTPALEHYEDVFFPGLH